MTPWSLTATGHPNLIHPNRNTIPHPYSYRNPNRCRIQLLGTDNRYHGLSPKLDANRCSKGRDFLRQLSASSVLLLGIGLGSLYAFSSPASARVPLASITEKQEIQEAEEKFNFEDEETKTAFDLWKSKKYALTVSLNIVALEGSLPPVWISAFKQSQGKRLRFQQFFRRGLKDIFHELSNPLLKGKINPKSAVTADLVTLGDSWLNFAIHRGLVEPMEGVEEQDWFNDLSDRWKVYLRRSNDGGLDSQGRIWAVPYRWGTMVIAYNKKEFLKHKLPPIEDWSDLWRAELSGKISMVDSPREIVGAVLKYLGASYNTTNIDSQVVGGRNAVLQHLELLFQQVRLFDSQYYLKAFRAGDVWVAVGWSNDVLPVAKTMSNIAVVVPKSGASLWADLWAVPSVTNLATDQIGGRIRGPSPLVHQWIEFCLQKDRALPFNEEIIAGASPNALDAPVENSEEHRNGSPKLDTNLVANVPPAEIMSKCELLEPLSEDSLSDYRWLLSSLQETNHSFVYRMQHSLSSTISYLWNKMKIKVI